MKKIILLIAFVFASISLSAQNPQPFPRGLTTPFIELDTLTTVQMNAMVIKDSKRRVVYNIDDGVLKVWDGDSWEAIGGSGVTNLSTIQTPTTVSINSDTGTDATIPLGNGIDAGVSINDYTNADKALVANSVQLTGAQTITGSKTFNTGSTLSNIISNNTLNPTGAGILATNSASGGFAISAQNSASNGFAVFATAGSGTGLRADAGTGTAIYALGGGAGRNILSQATGTGNSIVSDITTTGTGFAFVGRNNGVNTFTVNKTGDVIGNTFNGVSLTTGGSATDFLNAQGNYVAAGGGATQLSDLTDVNTSTPTNRNALLADGVDWESRPIVEADISDFGSYIIGSETVNNLFGGSTAGENIVLDGGSTAFGVGSLQNSNAINNTALGFESGRDNTGQRSTFAGLWSGKRNIQNDATGVGQEALQFNRGLYSTAIGVEALQINLNNNATGLGFNAGIYNEGDNNTAVGSNSLLFIPDVTNLKSFTIPDVNAALNRITITAHGFGSNGTYVNLLYQGVTGGITNNVVYPFQIIDANTIEILTDEVHDLDGTEVGDLTPQFKYTNVTALGYNSQPTASNQVVLGDTNVTSVITTGTIKAADAVNPNELVSKQQMDAADAALVLGAGTGAVPISHTFAGGESSHDFGTTITASSQIAYGTTTSDLVLLQEGVSYSKAGSVVTLIGFTALANDVIVYYPNVAVPDTYTAAETTVAATPTNYTPADGSVEGHLSGIDTALGSSGSASPVIQGSWLMGAGISRYYYTKSPEFNTGSAFYQTTANNLPAFNLGGISGIGLPITDNKTITSIKGVVVGSEPFNITLNFIKKHQEFISGDFSITATDNTLTSVTYTFVAGDVGKTVRVIGAGTGGVTLTTTIASFTGANEVELTAPADTTVASANGALETNTTLYTSSAIGVKAFAPTVIDITGISFDLPEGDRLIISTQDTSSGVKSLELSLKLYE